MLIRALLGSVLLHFMVLLSVSRLDVFVLPATSGLGVSALEMRIAEHNMHEQISFEASKRRQSDAKPETVARMSKLPSDQKAARFNSGRFFRSTVEVDNPGYEASARSADLLSAESPPATAAEIGQYRLNVARSARQFKVYPLLARENGWEGVVHVSVTMPIGLEPPAVSLDRSSGHETLDLQALEMVELAVNLATVPEGMNGRGLRISVPVEYRLAD